MIDVKGKSHLIWSDRLDKKLLEHAYFWIFLLYHKFEDCVW